MSPQGPFINCWGAFDHITQSSSVDRVAQFLASAGFEVLILTLEVVFDT